MDNYRRITSDQLREQLRAGHSCLILDVRSGAEFEMEHIAGAVNMPLDKLKVEEFLKGTSQKQLVLICATGKLAYQAADMFFESGFHDFKVVAGGLLSWKVLGFPLVGKAH